MNIHPDSKVTVVVRTIGRPTLTKALESVLTQSYSNCEILIVNAGCKALTILDGYRQNLNIRIITPDSPLKRSAAANFGLQHCAGSYNLFLDDDDWLHPGHIQRLVDTLSSHPKAILAYAGVECVNSESHAQTHVFDHVFSHAKLLAENYIPIHAALFRHTAWEQGCRFDENFDFHEDWDFWIQLAQLTDFAHCPGISATYMMSPDGSGIWQKQDDVEKSVQKIYEKWWKIWTAQGTLTYLQLLRNELFSSRQQVSEFHILSMKHAEEQQAALAESEQYAASLERHLERKEMELSRSIKYTESLELHLENKELELSKSIKYTESLELHLENKELELSKSIKYTESLELYLENKELELSESKKYTESLKLHLENKETELSESKKYTESLKLHLENKETELSESIKYTKSLKIHLENKELELSDPIKHAASLKARLGNPNSDRQSIID